MRQLQGAPAPILTEDPQWLKGSGVVRGWATNTILLPAQDVYNQWRDLESAPIWMERIVRVVETGEKTSTWTMQVSDDKQVSWNSEIVSDVPGEKIAWRSVRASSDAKDGETLDEAGEVIFYDRGEERGTEVLVVMEQRIPGGAVSNAIAGVVERSPRQMVIENLRHFKSLVETGEIPSVKGQPHGPRGLSGGFKEKLYGEHNPEPPGVREDGPAGTRRVA